MKIGCVVKKYLPQSNLSFQGTANDAKQIASEQLSLKGGQFSEKYLQSLAKSIDRYVKKAESINKIYETQYQHFQNMTIQLKNESKYTTPKELAVAIGRYRRWLTAKDAIEKHPQIQTILQEGYVLIDVLRTAVVGNELTYYVGMEAGGGKSKALYQGYLTLQQIINMSYASGIWKSTMDNVFKLRLKKNISNLQNSLQKANQIDYKLFSDVRKIALRHNITKNEGNIFEAYRGLVKAGQLSATESEIISYLQDTIENTASFIKGGDIDNESIKFFKGDPSFASLNTLIISLKLLSQTLKLNNTQQIQSGLEIFFTKEGAKKFNQGVFDSILNEELQKLYSALAKT